MLSILCPCPAPTLCDHLGCLPYLFPLGVEVSRIGCDGPMPHKPHPYLKRKAAVGDLGRSTVAYRM